MEFKQITEKGRLLSQAYSSSRVSLRCLHPSAASKSTRRCLRGALVFKGNQKETVAM